MPKESREFLFNKQKKGQKFEERLQIMARAWPLKWKDPLKHTQNLLASYASGS